MKKKKRQAKGQSGTLSIQYNKMVYNIITIFYVFLCLVTQKEIQQRSLQIKGPLS